MNLYIPSINRTIYGVKTVIYERGLVKADNGITGKFSAFRVNHIGRLAVDISSYDLVDHADFLHSILAIYVIGELEPIYVARPALCAFYAIKPEGKSKGGASEEEGGDEKQL